MSDDYLWSGSGEPDPQINQLEHILGEFRWSGKLPELQPAPHKLLVRHKAAWVAAAAAIVTVFGLGMALLLQRTSALQRTTSWQLLAEGHGPSSLHLGQVIETGGAHATVRSDSVGQIDVDPDSRLRVPVRNEARSALALDRGTIHAFVWAPPAKFVVETPAANTVDLGCRYTLSVARNGDGFLKVEMGWVAFQWHAIESFIPEGAACRTRIGYGPGTPYFLDAPPPLTEALAKFDSTGDRQSLHVVLEDARAHDGLTLWHLLERTRGEERAHVFDRFTELAHLPPTATRAGVLRGDKGAMDAAWNALDLGDTSWWRSWKRDW